MKKSLLIIALLFTSFTAFTDDGGSYKPEDWTYGNIYVKEPNDKIALERELLVVEHTYIGEYDRKSDTFHKTSGREVTARFDFLNTTRERVTVPCAFPVVVKTQVSVKKDGTVSAEVPVGNGYMANETVMAIAFGKSGIEGAAKEALLSLDKKLRTLSAKDYLAELSRTERSDSVMRPCSIEQDGNSVPILTVGIETTVEKDEEGTNYISEDNWHDVRELYTLTLVLHFYHELHFPPAARSKLSVKYDLDSVKKSYRGSSYALTYDISTGGTWKGAMKSFVVLSDGTMTAHGSQADFEKTEFGELSINGVNFNLYTVENYKPQKSERLVFKTKTPYRDGLSIVWERQDGRQTFVKGVRSSSAYKGSYKIAGDGEHTNFSYQNEDAYLRTSGYGVDTSFDGILFNGWVEGRAGDGIGEWIEFTLTKAALGPFASNGLARFAGRLYSDYGSGDPDFTVFTKSGYAGATWKENNRIKSMMLTSSALQKPIALELADIFPATMNDFSHQWIALNAVKNPLILPKGNYRMTIRGVYKGEKYDDTAIGEVWFLPLSAAAERILTADCNNDRFYTAPITDIVQTHVAHYVSRLAAIQQDEEGQWGK